MIPNRPGSSRGGATGNNQKTRKAIAVVMARLVRARGVALGVPEGQPEQGQRRHDEVGPAVVEVEEADDVGGVEERHLDRLLVEEVEQRLQVDDGQRVAGRARPVLDHVAPEDLVDGHERGDEGELFQQAEAAGASGRVSTLVRTWMLPIAKLGPQLSRNCHPP